MAALSSLEDWSIENLRGFLKVNEMLCEIGPALASLPVAEVEARR